MLLEVRPIKHNFNLTAFNVFCISFAAAHTDVMNLLAIISELGMDTSFIKMATMHHALLAYMDMLQCTGHCCLPCCVAMSMHTCISNNPVANMQLMQHQSDPGVQ